MVKTKSIDLKEAVQKIRKYFKKQHQMKQTGGENHIAKADIEKIKGIKESKDELMLAFKSATNAELPDPIREDMDKVKKNDPKKNLNSIGNFYTTILQEKNVDKPVQAQSEPEVKLPAPEVKIPEPEVKKPEPEPETESKYLYESFLTPQQSGGMKRKLNDTRTLLDELIQNSSDSDTDDTDIFTSSQKILEEARRAFDADKAEKELDEILLNAKPDYKYENICKDAMAINWKQNRFKMGYINF